MTTQTADTAVRTSIAAEAPAQLAFEVFTQDMADWWPPDHHIIEAELAEMVFVLNGVVARWEIRDWDEVLAAP